jgi:hypothetical protein
LGSISICNKDKKTEAIAGGNEALKTPFAIYNQNTKEVDVHIFTPDFAKSNEKDIKKFNKLIRNYLISF